MSLRLRLNVILTCVLLATVVVGMSFLMLDVRRSIRDELNASVELSSKLIALALRQVAPDDRGRVTREIAGQLARVGDTRHLSIRVVRGNPLAQYQIPIPRPPGVPNLFVRLVHPEPLQLVRVLTLGDGPDSIIVTADAADEISETWGELKPILVMLMIFAVVANVLVYVVLGRSLASLNRMTLAFQAIEAGEFDVEIAGTGVGDVDAIIERFNHMSGVLRQANRETQLIAQRSLAIQEDERRRLAQELHDELGQSISAIKALAVSISQRSGPEPSAVATSAGTIVDVSTEIYDQVRRMMAHLRPVVLDEFGLVSALESMVDDWNAHHEDTFCRFGVEGDVGGLPDDVAINCYRVVQEALTNMAKHAAAGEASVFLVNRSATAENASMLTIRIEDKGCGFDPATTPRGLGLVGIHERVEAMNGKVELTSARGEGTQFFIEVPWTREQAANE